MNLIENRNTKINRKKFNEKEATTTSIVVAFIALGIKLNQLWQICFDFFQQVEFLSLCAWLVGSQNSQPYSEFSISLLISVVCLISTLAINAKFVFIIPNIE